MHIAAMCFLLPALLIWHRKRVERIRATCAACDQTAVDVSFTFQIEPLCQVEASLATLQRIGLRP